ncbi:hypothetical protein BJX68DRAFT_268673 [Aspergillus pseudodeflectus]|uniref:NAD(P)-binding protein n=1 Tax=Aspergillus pseudodeflectus TaxID=176178 RepID=A0ABR4K2N1_9EURO
MPGFRDFITDEALCVNSIRCLFVNQACPTRQTKKNNRQELTTLGSLLSWQFIALYGTTSSQTIVLITASSYRTNATTSPSAAGRDITNATAAAETLRALPNVQGRISLVQLDVTNESSIAAAKTYIETTFSRLDILVNNVAISFLMSSMNLDILRTSFETNLVGVAAVTDSFLPLLRRSTTPRLILVNSSNGSLTYNSDPDCPHGGTYASEYRITKAALNMLLVRYHASLKDVTVLGVDPGFCATEAIGDTDALRRQGAAEPEVGGAVVARVLHRLRLLC